MQRDELLPEGNVAAFLSAVSVGATAIYEAYSGYEVPTRIFRSHAELLAYVSAERHSGRHDFAWMVHYEEAGGSVRTRRIELVPEKCRGAKWRETTEGWGMVAVHLTFQDDAIVKCRVSANSEVRAVAWASTLGNRLGSPNAWNWPMVEKQTRRLIRKLRSAA